MTSRKYEMNDNFYELNRVFVDRIINNKLKLSISEGYENHNIVNFTLEKENDKVFIIDEFKRANYINRNGNRLVKTYINYEAILEVLAKGFQRVRKKIIETEYIDYPHISNPITKTFSFNIGNEKDMGIQNN